MKPAEKRAETDDKRNNEDAYGLQKRGGKGTKNFRITDKTGDVVAVEIVTDHDEVMLISEQGKIIRFDTQGLCLVNSKGKTKLTKISVGVYVFVLVWEGHQDRLVE